MRYIDFKKKVRNYPVITSALLATLREDERILRNQLSRWQKQGLVIQLKRGLYLLNEQDRAIQPSRFFLANQLVFPSYISLETALSFYHIIPEAVYQITSVTTTRPARYETPEGVFSFRSIKASLFFGFETIKDERGYDIFMAEPEKALLDFFYLNMRLFSPEDPHIFSASYRFSADQSLQIERLQNYTARFGSPKLQKIVELFIDEILIEAAHA